MPRRQLAYRHVQRTGDRPPDGLLWAGLDFARAPQPLQCLRPERVQQHCLADTTQPGEHHAALRPAACDPLKHHVELAKFPVPPGEFGRPLTGTWRIRISYRVHGIGAYGGL